jgi:hypothetical protein
VLPCFCSIFLITSIPLRTSANPLERLLGYPRDAHGLGETRTDWTLPCHVSSFGCGSPLLPCLSMRFTPQWFSVAGRLWRAAASQSREEKEETAGMIKRRTWMLLQASYCLPKQWWPPNQVSTPLFKIFPVCVFCLAIVPYLCFCRMQIYLFSVHAK